MFGLTFESPDQLVGDVVGKTHHQTVCGQSSHHDLGEIRTEKAIRPTLPEKKERMG